MGVTAAHYFRKAIGIFFIVTAMLQHTPCFAAKVDFKLSKMHALFVFAQTATGEPHRSTTLREYFEKGPLNSPEVNSILKDFHEAYSTLGGGFNFDGLPKDRKAGSNGESLFLIQSVFAKDISDLEGRTIGLMPMPEHIKIISALRRFLPYYEKTIWNPSLKKLQVRKEQLVKVAQRAKLEELFSSVSRFYGTQWPDGRSFTISLYPIPGKRGHTSAEQIESIESVGVLTDEDEAYGRFGVMFHELCHSLYDAQAPQLQSDIDHWFKKEPAPYSLIAYGFINEVLATALGNGLAAERAAGHPDSGSWYNEHYTNDFAKAIYPEVVSYVKTGRSIDQAFVKQSVGLFKTTFPDAPLDTLRMFNRVVMLVDSDNFSSKDIKEALSQRFRVNSRSIYNELDDSNGLAEIKGSSDTVVVIASYKHADRLKGLPTEWKAIAETHHGTFVKSKPTVLWSEISTGRSLVVILADDTPQVIIALDGLKRLGKIDSTRTIQAL